MITIYHCELCSNQSENKREIEKCESQGLFDGSLFVPGTMFEYNHNGFVGIFAIPDKYPQPLSPNTHLGNLPYWACRALPGVGDSLDHLCCGDLVYSGEKGFKNWVKNHYISNKYLEHDTFKRMVKHLQSKGITPRYYDKKGKLHFVKGGVK